MSTIEHAAHLYEKHVELREDEKIRARHVVAASAANVDDARFLLESLGLLHE